MTHSKEKILLWCICLFRFALGMEQDTLCSVCLDSVDFDPVESQKNVRIGCLHKFHKQCLQEWYSWRNTCPICRRVIRQAFYCDGNFPHRNIIGDLQAHIYAPVNAPHNNLQQPLIGGVHGNPNGQCCCCEHFPVILANIVYSVVLAIGSYKCWTSIMIAYPILSLIYTLILDINYRYEFLSSQNLGYFLFSSVFFLTESLNIWGSGWNFLFWIMYIALSAGSIAETCDL